MQNLRALVLILLVAAVGAAVFVFWPRADVAPTPATNGPVGGGADRAEPAAGGTDGSSAVESAADPVSREAAAVAAAVPEAGGPAVLIGKVVDEQGQPVVGATVVGTGGARAGPRGPAARRIVGAARQPALTELARGETTTDAQGMFRVAVAAAGDALFVRVRARGHRVLDRPTPRATGPETDLGVLTLKRAGIVSGRVVDTAGAAIVGARVTRESVRPSPANAGGAEFGGADFGMPDFGDFDFGDMVGGDIPVGDTEFADGLAFPGAQIVRDMMSLGSVTDAEGRFELAHCEPGDFTLRARHAEHPSARREGLSVAAGAVLVDVVVTMAPGATIEGRLVGVPDGVKSLRVLVASVRTEQAPVDGPFGGFAAEMSEAMGDFGGVGERSCEVGADRSFVLRGLHQGRSYRLWAAQSGAGNTPSVVCSQKLEVRAPTAGLELRYDPGVVVTFQVVDGNGEPIERLWVRDQLRGGGGMAELMAMAPRSGASRTYPDGRVTLSNLRPKKKQTLALTVDAVRFRSYERKDIVLPLEGALDLGVLRLEPAPVLDVVVRAQDTGAPIAGAQVRVSAAGAAAARGGSPFERITNRLQAESGPRSARTDERGVCTLNAPMEGPITVEVTSQDFAPYASAPFAPPVAGAVGHEVVLLRGGAVEVLAVDDAGAGLPDVRIQHATPSGARDTKASDRTGRAEFVHLAPGTHRFRIAERGAGPDFAAMAAEFGGEAAPPTEAGWQAVDVVDGGRAEVRLTKDPTATLRGVVRENGKPLAGARITFLAGPGAGDGSQSAEGIASMMAEMGGGDGGRAGRSGDDGAFELKNLKAGQHRVRVTAKGRAMPAVVPVSLQPGDNVLDLALDTAIVRGVVRDPQGRPVPGASVAVVAVAPRGGDDDPMAKAMGQMMPGFDPASIGGAMRSVKTGDDGRYELRGVQTGARLLVRATAKAFAAADSEPFELAANGERSGVDIQLLAAGKVRVTTTDSKPFTTAQARLLDATGEPAPGVPPVMQVLGNGSGTLTGLRAGRWRIDLVVPTGGAPLSRTVDVVAGETVAVAF